MRRNRGVDAERRAFGRTRALRRSGAIDYRLYLAHADIEEHVNGEPGVARRVLEHGISDNVSYISEPKYVAAYMQLLAQVGGVYDGSQEFQILDGCIRWAWKPLKLEAGR